MPRLTPAEYLERLRGFARARGGKVLSRAYLGDLTKLRFRCAEGHEWWQAPGGVQQGKWCAVCGRARTAAARKAPIIARFYRLVTRRGGVVRSPQYVTAQTRLRLACRRGHEWEAVPARILRGSWCPICAGKKIQGVRRHDVLVRLRNIAAKRGGRVLSPAFEGSKIPIWVRCAHGHRWAARADSFDRGVWCRACEQESLLALLRSIAKRWGGACLSRHCRNGKDWLLWRCIQGHRWRARAEQIKRGIWCAKCRLPSPGDLGRMRRIAHEHGGECLSKTYVDSATKLWWRCREGHEWDADPAAIVQGSWCRICERGWGRSRVRLSIEIMHEMAAERGGKCLSSSYNGIYARLRWRCARGHEWVSVANNIRRGWWCPRCAHSTRGTLDGMRALAIERGGRCLTRIWDNHARPMLFACGQGHRFSARANVIKTGVWCPQCKDSRASSAPVSRGSHRATRSGVLSA
jgi:hypothetical protein